MQSNFLPSIEANKCQQGNLTRSVASSKSFTNRNSNLTMALNNNSDNKTTSALPQVIELNVGGHYFTTSLSTLLYESGSVLSNMFTGNIRVAKDSRGRYFIDRDGVLFRFVLDYLRNNNLTLPTNFDETERLLVEAEFYRLKGLCKLLKKPKVKESLRANGKQQQESGYITLCVRGTYAFGRDGIADVKFRKLQRIIVCGNVGLTREVFQDMLNETRDPDRDLGCYSSRFYLKHPHLEMAFDKLHESNFKLVTSAAGGAGYDLESEETKWNHFTNYVFFREL